MILAALDRLYDRLAAELGEAMPRPGWNRRKVSFALLLRPDGSVAQLSDLRDNSGRKPTPREMLVPDHGETRTSAAKTLPYFLCDGTSFLLGAHAEQGDKALDYFANARALHQRLLTGCDDPFAAAILAFFATWTPADAADLCRRHRLDWEREVSGANLVFGLDGHREFAHQRPALAGLWEAEFARRPPAPAGQCLISGAITPIARLHAGIKLPGTVGNGAPVISFNAESFTSYGHSYQGMNAPIGEAVAFRYAAALNTLVAGDGRRRLVFGDTTVVFWAEKEASQEERMIAALLGLDEDKEAAKTDTATTQRVETVLRDLRRGRPPRDTLAGLDTDTRFYVLGVAAPGGSRVAVRFWLVSTFGELIGRIGAHQAALALEKRTLKDPDHPSLRALLRAVVPQGKDDAIPGPLAAALAQAALTGLPYPRALLAMALARMRAEHGPYEPVSYLRVALVKACLTRSSDWEPQEMLNADDTDPAYRLGRLFAALERAQQLALGMGLNATIKDHYFGAASSSPRAVFPNLLRLAQHHLSKAEAGWLDKLIGDILDPIATFPPMLDLDAQGRFALGYYHQRNDLWRKKTPQTTTES